MFRMPESSAGKKVKGRIEDMEKKTALVTGASSGIGMAISKRMCQKGYEVYGFGRDFSKTEETLLTDPSFHAVTENLLMTDKLTMKIKEIRKKGEISVLVNNAGSAYYGLHEEISPAKLSEMVRTNLEVPMILTQMLLRDFKKNSGTIINIASVTALSHANPHGAAYGATKAGLLSFSESIFEEARKYGVRVTTILPDMTKTDLYRNADFDVDLSQGAFLEPEEVAEAVEYVLARPEGVVVPQIVLRPQYHRISRK